MDDRFLTGMRREPRPEFARELHERLRRQGPAVAPARPWRPLQLAVALAGGLVVALVVLSFTFPAVRASAQAFLDLFRVRNFAAVSVNPARVARLRDLKLDPESMMGGGQAEILEPAGEPRVVATVQEAGAAAGFAVRVPAQTPAGFRPDTIVVAGASAARFTVDTARLTRVLDALDIRDVRVPAGLDGQVITVRTTPAVAQRFVRDRQRVDLLQARSPEVSLPAGVDLARLGEIGLRIAGLEPGEAKRFAQSIDWHGTLVVPVPLNASSFSEVSVNGNRGLLVVFAGSGQGPHGVARGNLLLWTDGDLVFALRGDLNRMDLVQMAESLH